tara:strand:- start:38 stop:193 length:156 start_codon:yes stop_codon:yes gene_type:complete
MIYYDKKGYEDLRDSVLWLERLWKRGRQMVELKAIAGALVLISVLYFIWRD